MPKGTKTIGTRWVDVNKQDQESPLYRSRLVAQEVKKGSGFDEFLAAMPSLSALKMPVTITVTFQLPHAGAAVKEAYAKRGLLGFLDVKRAIIFIGRDKGALCGTSCKSQETWRRCSWKMAQVALRNAWRTSGLGVADSETYDRL